MARPRIANEVVTRLSASSRYGRHVSEQPDRSAVTADHRSIVPSVPGVPWWAAVVVAVTGVAVGFAFDAGSGKELTSVFSGLYVVGCLAAVLAVRQSGVFTAVIQPPLILFCAVPGAYFLFHGAKFTGVKDLVINCGYPLIERFPLMLFTSAGVLLVGLVRWYLGHGPVARGRRYRRRRGRRRRREAARTGREIDLALPPRIRRRRGVREGHPTPCAPGTRRRAVRAIDAGRTTDRAATGDIVADPSATAPAGRRFRADPRSPTTPDARVRRRSATPPQQAAA